MKRRDFITLLGGAAAWPIAARAQQPAMPTVGFLNSASFEPFASRVQAFREGLSSIGYIEGQNVTVEYRWGEGHRERMSALTADLVHRHPSVITAMGTTEALTAKAATTTIPIVFAIASDPVALGLVAALNRPGGNLTGITALAAELGPKKLELLHEVVPKTTRVALIVNPANRNAEAQSTELKAAALTLGIEMHVLSASTERELEIAFASLVNLQVGAVVIGTDTLFTNWSKQIADLTVRHAVPTVFQYRDFAAAGGLMSYGGSFTEAYRLAGIYTGRILKGERPANLPVQRYAKLELIINLRTAKELGLTVPPPLLAFADEVIE
jgi:putative ABC transport system substrate-binding protein